MSLVLAKGVARSPIQSAQILRALGNDYVLTTNLLLYSVH